MPLLIRPLFRSISTRNVISHKNGYYSLTPFNRKNICRQIPILFHWTDGNKMFFFEPTRVITLE